MVNPNVNLTIPSEKICLPYSVPRIVVTPIQCSFGTYFWEMYTTEFGWSVAEYGTVQLFFSGVQVVFYLILGLIFWKAITGTDDQKIKTTKPIEIVAIIIHACTFFLLIILPIRWHGVKTPYVDSMLGKQSQFFQGMFGGPVPLSSMATSKGWYWFFCIPWFFVKLFWIPLYPFMKLSFFCGGCCMSLLRIIRSRRTKLTRIIPVLETLRDPACSACCNTTCCNNFAMRMNRAKQFMGTKTFFVYFLVTAHGIAMSAFELSNKALTTYIYPKLTGTGQGSTTTTKPADANTAIRGNLINLSMQFFTVTNLLIILLFSLVKFYIRSGAKFAETFYVISILFLIIQIPILPGFYQTEKDTSDDTTRRSLGKSGSDPAKPWWKVFCLTCFHTTTTFWIFTGGPLTFYVSAFVLNWHKGIGSFGVFTILVGFAGAMVIPAAISLGDTRSDGPAAKLFAPNSQQWVTGVCIGCQLFTFLFLFPFNYWWNKRNWLNYVILVLTGATNTIFLTYTYVMLDDVVKGKDEKWILIGAFFAITNLVVTVSMLIMFRSFACCSYLIIID